MDLDFLVCILLECERTKTKILYFYKGTKWLPFKKGPKLCASDFGDVQKNMIYLVWRSPAFEGPIFMFEQERWQRWLKKSRANLANIVTLWDCPCRVPAYAHDGPLLSWGNKQGEKMRANANFQDIITLCDVLCLWLSRSLCPWWPNLHNQQIPARGRHQSTGCNKIAFSIFIGPNSFWFGMVCYVWYVIWCLMLFLWSSLITKLVCYLTWKHNKSENRQHHIMCSCKTRFSCRD